MWGRHYGDLKEDGRWLRRRVSWRSGLWASAILGRTMPEDPLNNPTSAPAGSSGSATPPTWEQLTAPAPVPGTPAPAPAGPPPASGAAAPTAAAPDTRPAAPDTQPAAQGQPPDASQTRRGRRSRRAGGKGSKRRSWVRWVANLMIIGGVLALPGYFLGTCACTALEQNRLRDELQASHPQLAVAEEALASDGFVTVETITTTTLPPTATEEEISAAEAAIEAAKAKREADLLAFKAAADAFEKLVGGKTGEPLGKIMIPDIGVDVVMVEGTSVRDLKEGPGHWSETPFPGQGGNFVVSGHRTTYGAPFFKLNEVEVGDEIDLVLPYAVVRYTVSKTMIVYPDEVETVAQKGREQISLAACHPIYSAKQRIVVQGELTSFKLVEPEG